MELELPCTIGRTRDPTEALQGHTIVGTIREQWHQWREADTFGNRRDRLVTYNSLGRPHASTQRLTDEP